MTAEEWKNALVDPEGPFAAERIATLKPEPELLEALRDTLRLPWPKKQEGLSTIAF